MSNKSIILLVLALFCCLLYLSQPLGPFESVIFDVGLVFVLLSIVFFFKYSQNSLLKGYWIRPSIFFLIGYIAVNFQYLADCRLGLKAIGTRTIPHSEILNHCLILGVVGILSFVAGYIIKPIKNQQITSHISRYIIKIPQRSIIVALNAITFIAFILTIDLMSFLTGADFSDSGEGISLYFEDFLYVTNALVVLCVCLNAPPNCTLKQYIKSYPVLSLIVVVLYMTMRLLSGDRGPFIYTAMLLLFGYLYSTRAKLKLVTVLMFLLLAMVFISAVGIARSLEVKQRFGERMSEALEQLTTVGRFAERDEKSVFPPTDELGFSFIVNQTDVYSIEVEGESFNYGSYTLIELLSSIPFMPRIIQSTFNLPPEKLSSAEYANYHFFGGYERKWGIGTTIIGDFYLQLGIWGVLLGLFFTGMLMRYLDVTLFVTNRSSITAFSLLFVILFSSKSIYMPRSIVFTDLSTFVLGALLLLLLGVGNTKILRKV